jgi:uncharacterized protein (TIGR02453 family)
MAIFDDAVTFFRDLEQNNTREFWQRERHRYDASVRLAFVAVTEGLEAFGKWRIYRPNNDVRFGNAKGPYKTFIGAVAERADGLGAFLQVSAKGVLIGTGIPMPAPDQLGRLRAAIAEDESGTELVAAIEAVARRDVVVHGGRWEPLKRVPAGYGADHPRADLLRWKGVEANSRIGRPRWTKTDQAVEAVNALMTAPAELHSWLGRSVGPSALTPEERFAPRRR